MMFLIDRGPRSSRWVVWKTRIVAVAATLALVGMGLDAMWITGTALALLIVAVLLRFLPEPRGGEPPDEEDETDIP